MCGGEVPLGVGVQEGGHCVGWPGVGGERTQAEAWT